MIYLPQSELYFVHVPKCAGQSLIRALMDPEEASLKPLAQDLGLNESTLLSDLSKGYDHPRLGRIHPGHLPMSLVREELPNTWSAISQSRVFCVTRDPRDRFISAVMQRLKEFKDAGSIRADDPKVREEAERVCSWLEGKDLFVDMDYIHFTRQIDYVELTVDGATQRLNSVQFPMSEIAALVEWLAEETGHTIDVTRDHVRRQPKRWARALQPAARFAGRRLMPNQLKRVLYPLWVGSGAFANASSGYHAVQLGPDVEEFIQTYYAKDAVLYEQSKAWTSQNSELAVPARKEA